MSSKKNKRARLEIEERYGKGCMLEKADVQGKIEKIGGIKTYRQYISEIRFSGPKVEQLRKLMTYHHLKHKSDGGPATVENGAEVSALGQMYIHSLPRHHEEIVNNILRDYKYQEDKKRGTYQECKIELIEDLELGFVINTTEMSLDDLIPRKKQKHDRAKAKREFEKRIREEMEDYER